MAPLSDRPIAALALLIAFCLLLINIVGCSNHSTPSNSGDPSVPATAEVKVAPSVASSKADVRHEGTITVEGDGLTPQEKQALAAGFKQLLSEAIIKGMQERMTEMSRKLGIADKVEADLLSALPEVGEEAKQMEGLISIYLIRSGKPTDGPHTTVLAVDGKPLIRLTRALAAVEQPVALFTVTAVVNGQPSVSEWILIHQADGQWMKQQPSSRTENLSK
jgi:hypothetical protein